MKRFHVFLFITLSWLLTQNAVTVQGQGCVPPPRILADSRWLRGATVQVTIDTDFTANERQTIEDAFLHLSYNQKVCK